jgi:hypothetical protein
MKDWKAMLPASPFRGTARQVRIPVSEDVQTGIVGPPAPHPGTLAPHQDFALLVNGFVGDVQGVGGKISEVLDKPLDATIGIPGPHRLIGGFFDRVSGVGRDFVSKVSGT